MSAHRRTLLLVTLAAIAVAAALLTLLVPLDALADLHCCADGIDCRTKVGHNCQYGDTCTEVLPGAHCPL